MTGWNPDTLPVFQLTPDVFTDDALDTMATSWGLKARDFDSRDNRLRAAVRSRIVDIDRTTGIVWMADHAQLGIVPDVQPRLLETDAARSAAADLFTAAQPAWSRGHDARLHTGLCADRGSRAAILRDGEPRRNLCLDRYVSLRRCIAVSPGLRVPVIDGAYRTAATFGSNGTATHLQFARCTVESAWMAPARDQDEVRSAYLAASQAIDDVEIEEMTLAYEHRGRGSVSYLLPVWQISASGIAGSRRILLPQALHPASDFIPPGETPMRSAAESPIGGPCTQRPLRNTKPRPAGPSVGAWWDSRGHLSSQQNAQQFIDELTASGWATTCNWGDEDALESDWVSHATDWVETLDLAYYAGHGSGRGWYLRPLSEAPLDFTKVGEKDTQHLLFGGAGRLKTIAICACGLLEDESVPPGRGDVFRWNGAFDGLHVLLGFGSQIGDMPDLGRDFANFATRGSPVIDAWFRAARQTAGAAHPWAAAMYAFAGSDNDPRHDHLPGCGPIAETSGRPDTHIVIWAPV